METLTITIPKNLASTTGELVVIPRKEYELFLTYRKFKEVAGTQTQKHALRRAEKNLSKQKTLSLNEFAKQMGFTD